MQVTAAVCQQLATLNTNSRYLSEALTGYTEQLLATFPQQLEVAYMVNSGSEANDLALRICR
jgi:4-aminobutyrate aminotransferase-like enzyme